MFSDVEHLERLELNYCALSDDTVSTLRLERLPQLHRLGLAGNNLSHVPSRTLRTMPLLETVDLSHNLIRRLEPCAFCGCNISHVLLAHNFLGVDREAIHQEAFADTKMIELDLSFNYLDLFDAGMLGKQKIFKLIRIYKKNFH